MKKVTVTKTSSKYEPKKEIYIRWALTAGGRQAICSECGQRVKHGNEDQHKHYTPATTYYRYLVTTTTYSKVNGCGRRGFGQNGAPYTCGQEYSAGKHISAGKEIVEYTSKIEGYGREVSVETEHTEIIDAKIEPTCDSTGKTEGKHCSVCNKILVAQEIIPAKGHTEVIDKKVEPTCDSTGKTQGKHCLVCNKILVEQKEIPALGHSYKNGICIRCGKKELKLDIKLEEYEQKDKYITKIQPQTTVNEFKKKLKTNAEEVKIYKDKKELNSDTLIGTGMRVELKLKNETKSFVLVVIGDTNGDGKTEISDMTVVNKHRLNKKTLQGAQLLAGDVTGDGKVDVKDIVRMNKYRLHKIKKLS